ncbi:FkbM family methyltransferase [Halotia wernerae UHCC 0503]|nr:FkbM family methyltransferase [Halotia wernerae UHCC 0503]
MAITLKGLLFRLKQALTVIFVSSRIYPNNKYSFHKISFSQDGEDVVITELFNNKSEGFYVDVGAHHPQRFSNTYYFYLQGWKGINIDAMPGSMNIFNFLRPNDINLEIPISDKSEILNYYEFDEPALNSFSLPLSQQRISKTNYKIVTETQLQTQTLAEVLDKHLPPKQTIDFLSIDVEGLDYQVLNSNNWDKYKPNVVLVEDLELISLENINTSKVYLFLEKKGYILVAKTIRTLIFRLES